MERASLPSVRIRYLDKRSVRAALDDYVHRITRKHPEIRRILLFGSLARDEAVPGSDVDILIELSSCEEAFLQRIPHFLPSHFPVGMDVFPYTSEELETMLQEGNHFVRHALREGVEIFSRCQDIKPSQQVPPSS